MHLIEFESHKPEDLIDITAKVQQSVSESKIISGICTIYIPHATSGVIINENDDPEIINHFLGVLRKLAPRGSFRHDRIDNNGDAHIKSALVDPSVTIPFSDGKLLLGTWQSIMLCEFDGPKRRKVIITIIPEN